MTTTYVKTLITDEATDADSPSTETLMQDIGQSINFTLRAIEGPLTAGDYLIIKDIVTTGQVTSSTPDLAKEVICVAGGTLRIAFRLLDGGSSGTLWGRIYRNGGAVGTTRIESPGAGANTTFWSEDIAGWAAGDSLQIYIAETASGGCQCDRLYVKAADPGFGFMGGWPFQDDMI